MDSQWEDDARTECEVLLKRIKDAFFEGFGDRAGPFPELAEYSWQASDAKRIHDTLQQLWSEQ